MKINITVFAYWLMLCTLSPLAFAAPENTTSTGARNYNGWTSSYNRKQTVPKCTRHCDAIARSSRYYGVPSALVLAIIRQESNFNHRAVSPKGAKGLMQLMDMNSTHIDPFNPEQNIHTGTALLARLLNQYDSIELALAAYNAGEGNVRKYGGVPPFKETQNYIKKVMLYYRGYQS